MAVRVELIYQDSCPNLEGARAVLRDALSRAGRTPRWAEWERDSAGAPDHAKLFGSPTILVDGRDVVGAAPGDGAESCRVYGGGQQGIPPVDAVLSALVAAGTPTSRWSRALAVMPGAGLALLPIGACPACWPVYAGLLGSLGLGFLLDSSYLLPLTGVFLVLALVALGYGAAGRRGYGPFALGVGAAAAILIGKFALASNALLYLGLAFLIGASIWNTWPLRAARTGICGKCAPRVSGPNESGAAEERG